MQHQTALKHKQLLGVALVACVWISTTGPAGAQSIQTVRASAIKGDVKAQTELSFDYAKGHGVPQNYANAAYWFRLAAKQGFARAENNLGTLYEGSPGVEKNYVKAYFWFDIAAANGDNESVENRDNISRLMTSGEIAKAQNLATQYASEHK